MVSILFSQAVPTYLGTFHYYTSIPSQQHPHFRALSLELQSPIIQLLARLTGTGNILERMRNGNGKAPLTYSFNYTTKTPPPNGTNKGRKGKNKQTNKQGLHSIQISYTNLFNSFLSPRQLPSRNRQGCCTCID